ncbi:hypothetical protein ACHAWU_003457 [Discostella pseudostelligera]|uniref:Uncharacterized protein n=1 Tax=Discostella pseudostelligera TaxID=259834 RepID=A0ABD3LXD5_9STRA
MLVLPLLGSNKNLSPSHFYKPRTILEMIRERNIEKEKAELTRRAETAESKLAELTHRAATAEAKVAELTRRAERAEARAVTAESKLAKVAEIITL